MFPLRPLIHRLAAFYGSPIPPEVIDPFEMIVWDCAAYLVSDERRQEVFAALRRSVGTRPEQILAAPRAVVIEAIAMGGMQPQHRADKLIQAAALAMEDFGGDLEAVLRRPLPEARRALKRFPGMGDPGADKVLLFNRVEPRLALDSNGLRVLLRMGYGAEKRDYAASYLSVQQAVAPHLDGDFDFLIGAHQLLRTHGQEMCKRTQPRCEACPLSGDCDHYRAVLPDTGSAFGRRGSGRAAGCE